DDARWSVFNAKQEAVIAEKSRLAAITVRPSDLGEDRGKALLGSPLTEASPAADFLKRPGVRHTDLADMNVIGPANTGGLSAEVAETVGEQVEIQAKYAGYIARQNTEIQRSIAHEETAIPDNLDYHAVSGLSNELTAKLEAARPVTIGQ